MSTWLDQFECLDVIGNGSFGVIRKVKRKSDGLIFARKDLSFSLMSERDRRQIVAEVNILKDLHNPHIVRYFDRYVDREAGILYILMEYCAGGDLSAALKRIARDAERQGIATPRGLDEDKVWSYLMQILRALAYCHHPNFTLSSSGGHTAGSGRNSLSGSEGDSKRPQILHRDLKPDNVFLDHENNVKLGDFGLSKALLQQASFANTYVGTPYYMSPELMQEKAYDSKSDIWSLGCLVYELCALKPPFHEAKTHAELSAFIRQGRIPPLPRGYSATLNATIKAMLNLNPAMRPSALQLLQHERIDYAAKVDETEKLIASVKAHKSAVVQREREVSAREQELVAKEAEILQLQQAFLEAQQQVEQLQVAVQRAQQGSASPTGISEVAVEARIRAAVARREEELRAAVLRREEQVNAAMAAREEELLTAVRAREEELQAAWAAREAAIIDGHEQALNSREEEVRAAWERREAQFRKDWEAREEEVHLAVQAREEEIERIWREHEEETEREWEEKLKVEIALALARREDETPHAKRIAIVDDPSNVSATSIDFAADESHVSTDESFDNERTVEILKPSLYQTPSNPRSRFPRHRLKTPLPSLMKELSGHISPPKRSLPLPASPDKSLNPAPLIDDLKAGAGLSRVPGSAMRGVVMTTTGQTLATPSPAEFVKMFDRPLKGVKLEFSRVFDGIAEDEDETPKIDRRAEPSSPRKAKERDALRVPLPASPRKLASVKVAPSSPLRRERSPALGPPPMLRPATSSIGLKKTTPSGSASGSRSAAPSLGTRPRRSSPGHSGETKIQGSSSGANASSPSTSTSSASSGSELTVTGEASKRKVGRPIAAAAFLAEEDPPRYNLDDEENLPSPFLKRIERTRPAPPPPINKVKANGGITRTTSAQPIVRKAATVGSATGRRMSSGNLLRVAAVNAAKEANKDEGDEFGKL